MSHIEVAISAEPSISRKSEISENSVIELLHRGENPKKRGAATRFAHYKTGLTVREYIELVGNKRLALNDLVWDQEHRWIRLQG